MSFYVFRRALSLAYSALAAFFLLSAVYAQSVPARQRILLDAGWRFQLAPADAAAGGVAITDWRWKPQTATPMDAGQAVAMAPNTTGADWPAARIGEDVFHGRAGFAWFRTMLPSTAKSHRVLHFESVDDNATVYLNGMKLRHHEGWDDPFDVPLDAAWKPTGPNVLAVLVENTGGQGGITGPVSIIAGPAETPTAPEAKPGFSDAGWRIVHLPHDYVVEGKFTQTADTGHGSLPVVPAWYRKTFTLPVSDKGKSLWIDFDGVYRDAKVYLNGTLLGENLSGYTPFRYDIGRAAHYGAPNILAVHVDPRHFEGWWYEGGGIYRHVWLNVAASVHVAPWGTFVMSKVSGVGSAHPSATLTIKTTVRNDSLRPQTCTLTSQLTAPSGMSAGSVKTPQTIPAGSSVEVTQTLLVRDAALWSLEHPQLYRLHTRVGVGSPLVDAVDTPFGIRSIRFDAQHGFFLNGKHVEIQGVCNHQDFAGVGIAVPDSLEYWRVAKLKEIGCNAWRTSHNPPNAELLDACDKLGMLVMDENRHLGDTEQPKTASGTPAKDLSELTTMILRDRNHPSIVMWSMCNEEPLQGTDEGAKIFAAMSDRVREYDTTRPITCAMNDGAFHGIALVEDLRGFNYNPGVYAGYHRDHPDSILYGSEIGSTTTTRGIYADDKARGYVSAYDTYAPSWAQTAEDTWTPIATQPFFAGGYVWTGFDYKGEPTPYGWPCINSHFGLLDMCGFLKDDAYYYKTVWKSAPSVHLLPHWNWTGQEGKPISVWAYSNASAVELFLNGTSLGRKTMPLYRHLEWSVPYTPGTLIAKAYSHGAVVATDTVSTTGAPAALKLVTDRTTLTADGEDVTPVGVDVVDAQGRIVPTAGNRVTFHVSGPSHIAGVGNGDPSDHDPDKATYRLAFNGRCMVIVGAGEKPGAITLTASSPGLEDATVRLKTVSK